MEGLTKTPHRPAVQRNSRGVGSRGRQRVCTGRTNPTTDPKDHPSRPIYPMPARNNPAIRLTAFKLSDPLLGDELRSVSIRVTPDSKKASALSPQAGSASFLDTTHQTGTQMIKRETCTTSGPSFERVSSVPDVPCRMQPKNTADRQCENIQDPVSCTPPNPPCEFLECEPFSVSYSRIHKNMRIQQRTRVRP